MYLKWKSIADDGEADGVEGARPTMAADTRENAGRKGKTKAQQRQRMGKQV